MPKEEELREKDSLFIKTSEHLIKNALLFSYFLALEKCTSCQEGKTIWLQHIKIVIYLILNVVGFWLIQSVSKKYQFYIFLALLTEWQKTEDRYQHHHLWHSVADHHLAIEEALASSGVAVLSSPQAVLRLGSFLEAVIKCCEFIRLKLISHQFSKDHCSALAWGNWHTG